MYSVRAYGFYSTQTFFPLPYLTVILHTHVPYIVVFGLPFTLPGSHICVLCHYLFSHPRGSYLLPSHPSFPIIAPTHSTYCTPVFCTVVVYFGWDYFLITLTPLSHLLPLLAGTGTCLPYIWIPFTFLLPQDLLDHAVHTYQFLCNTCHPTLLFTLFYCALFITCLMPLAAL